MSPPPALLTAGPFDLQAAGLAGATVRARHTRTCHAEWQNAVQPERRHEALSERSQVSFQDACRGPVMTGGQQS